MANDHKRNPHRIESLDHLIPERDLDERPRTKRGAPQPTPEAFNEYAITFAEEWPMSGRSIEYLRWKPNQIRAVSHHLNLQAQSLSQNAGAWLQIEGYDKITPATVLRYVVRHWRVFRWHLRLTAEHPVPEAIVKCCLQPNMMLDVMLALCGQRVLNYLIKCSREFQQLRPPVTDDQIRDLDGKHRWVRESYARVVKGIPWLEDGDWQEMLTGERIGKRNLTKH